MTTTVSVTTETTETALAPLVPTPETGRVQLALNVDDLDQAVAFYTALLGTPPAKLRPGYANFSVAAPPLKLVLLENPGKGGSLNHLGVEVPGSEAVQSEIARLAGEGLVTDEEKGTTCCYATQDKADRQCRRRRRVLRHRERRRPLGRRQHRRELLLARAPAAPGARATVVPGEGAGVPPDRRPS
jgi:catechol 2,3-dioxygenase-like lactoylglutathione lyase family enzyme